MWPVLLDMSQDDCRRTLRRFELEAYGKMMSVFRAQGALEDNRRKLLEELRVALRISSDRHSAEARRVANDEILATIAHQLSGPNTGLGWMCEGRRRVPLMPRGIPQTAYTELADEVAKANAEENKEIRKRELEKLVAPKSNEEEKPDAEGETAEDAMEMDDSMFPPLVIEDPTSKIWENEVASRKRKIPETGVIPEDLTTPAKNVRNVPVNANQKHLNLSQLYSKFSQPASNKPSGHSKHSYNQVGKVSNKTSQPRQPKTPKAPKQRAPKTPKSGLTKAQMKKAAKEMLTPTKFTSQSMQYSPNSFQASYAQSLMDPARGLFVEEGSDGRKGKEVAPGTTPHDLPPAAAPGDPAPAPAAPHTPHAPPPHQPPPHQPPPHQPPPHQPPSTPLTVSGKPGQLVIKKKGEITNEKKEPKVVHKASDIKLFSNRQMMVTPGSGHKTLGTPGKFITTKVIGPVGKTLQTTSMGEKVVVMSKPMEQKTLGNSKIIIPSSAPSPSPAGGSPRLTEAITPKGIPATDLKVSAAKTFLLNPKSGQKMVVVPAKARTKTGADGSPVPLIQLKGMPTTMRLVPVSQQQTPLKASTVTVVSKSSLVAAQSTPKVVSVEQIKTANMADIVPVKGILPATPKLTNAIVRPAGSKGSVIVVQKGATLGKAISFSKNPSEMNKIIMGKNISQLMQAKQDTESAKSAGNVILLDLNNDQTARTTTMSEILDSRVTRDDGGGRGDGGKDAIKITEDTPVLFDSQITDETCSANSLDSATESIGDMVPMETIQSIEIIEKEVKSFTKETDAKDTSSVTDWEMELDATVTTKDKDEDDKLNSLHLDLGMSSDSESEFINSRKKKNSPQVSIPRTTPSAESRETFDSSSGLSHATRTLLSQLQDEGSSSNDSSFALKSKILEKRKEDTKESGLNKSECDALTKAKERLSEKVAKSQQKRIDIYSTAISSADINLDSFSYLEEGMMGDEEFPPGDAVSSPSK